MYRALDLVDRFGIADRDLQAEGWCRAETTQRNSWECAEGQPRRATLCQESPLCLQFEGLIRREGSGATDGAKPVGCILSILMRLFGVRGIRVVAPQSPTQSSTWAVGHPPTQRRTKSKSDYTRLRQASQATWKSIIAWAVSLLESYRTAVTTGIREPLASVGTAGYVARLPTRYSRVHRRLQR